MAPMTLAKRRVDAMTISGRLRASRSAGYASGIQTSIELLPRLAQR